jgi:hypothetical protein
MFSTIAAFCVTEADAMCGARGADETDQGGAVDELTSSLLSVAVTAVGVRGL